MKAVFKKIWNTFKQVWCWSLFLTLTLCVLLVLWGDQVAIAGNAILSATSHKMVACFVLLIVWAACISIHHQIKKRQAQAAQDRAEIEAQAAQQSLIRETVDALTDRLNEAVATIKRAGLYGRLDDRVKYQLPWYMVIGPQSSGKTTLLECSGLDFPLNQASGKFTRDIQRSQHCEWYFANHAVLVDAGGRYFDQPESNIEGPVWVKFLNTLRTKRRRRPLNGLLLTIDIQTLQNPDENEIEQHARYVRERLQEIRHHLNSDIPVYLVLTKTDLVTGFDAFFAHLNRDDMDQVVGVTFNQGEGEQAEKVKFEFEELLRRFNAQLLPLFHAERDLARRSDLLQFPRQLSSIVERLALFCELSFSETRYHRPTHLRGLYLTSVPEPTTDITESTAVIGQNLSMSQRVLPTSRHQRGFFIRRLLDDVIFPNSELATLDEKYEQKIKWINRSVYIASALIIIGLGSVWVNGFLGNHQKQQTMLTLKNQYQDQLLHISPLADEIELLPALNTLYHSTQIYNPDQLQYLEKHSGLNQGTKIASVAEAVYYQQLQELLLPRITSELENQISSNQQNREFLTKSLRAYLMMNMQERMDKAFMSEWIAVNWSYRYSGSATEQNELQGHFNRLLNAGFKPVTLNQNLVAKTRKLLRQASTPELVYQQIKEEASNQKLSNIRFSDYLGPNQILFTNVDVVIPGLYSQQGYQRVFLSKGLEQVKSLINENWVVGTSSDLSALEIREIYADVENLYFRDYLRYWQDAVDQLKVIPVSTLDQAVSQTTSVTAAGQPVVKVLALIKENTTFVDESQLAKDGTKAGLEEGSKHVTNYKAKRLAKLAAGALPKADNKTWTARRSVSHQFDKLNTLIPDGIEASIPLQDALVTINDLNSSLSIIKHSLNTPQSSFDAARKRMQGKISEIDKVRNTARNLPQPLSSWWNQVADNAWNIVLTEAQKHVQMLYNDHVIVPYTLTLKGRYPFTTSNRDVNIADFNAFFQKDGVLDKFYRSTLAPFVQNRGGSLSLSALNGRDLGLSTQFMYQYSQGLQIQHTFYGRNKTQPKIGFKIAPFELDATALQAEFNYGDQTVLYRHGPIQKKSLSWPISEQRQFVNFVLKDLSGVNVVSKQATGPWAFFRILDGFKVNKYQGQDVLKIDLQNKGMNAQYLIYSDRTPTPFDRKLLKNFTLPKRLS
ncbi:type VI secretion system membrane subunit TssM [Photobacterium sp.]|uniref:type VI secretion system membrane subunit TssM n=1 Tax=Photobacterium sp. TaxID=660 RepID=UPI00299EC8C0|nr:type VI secretion system membrane subunit TssM [Photobacterium sp.]MDX1302275.1 type VI secretion system membrane subunit TssM [Photobacterium sp.]